MHGAAFLAYVRPPGVTPAPWPHALWAPARPVRLHTWEGTEAPTEGKQGKEPGQGNGSKGRSTQFACENTGFTPQCVMVPKHHREWPPSAARCGPN